MTRWYPYPNTTTAPAIRKAVECVPAILDPGPSHHHFKRLKPDTRAGPMSASSSPERGEGVEGVEAGEPSAGSTAESALRWGLDVSTLLMGRSPRLSFFGEGGHDGLESDDIPDMISPLSSMDASQVDSTSTGIHIS